METISIEKMLISDFRLEKKSKIRGGSVEIWGKIIIFQVFECLHVLMQKNRRREKIAVVQNYYNHIFILLWLFAQK